MRSWHEVHTSDPTNYHYLDSFSNVRVSQSRDLIAEQVLQASEEAIAAHEEVVDVDEENRCFARVDELMRIVNRFGYNLPAH